MEGFFLQFLVVGVSSELPPAKPEVLQSWQVLDAIGNIKMQVVNDGALALVSKFGHGEMLTKFQAGQDGSKGKERSLSEESYDCMSEREIEK